MDETEAHQKEGRPAMKHKGPLSENGFFDPSKFGPYQPRPQYKNTSEFASALRQWMCQYQWYQYQAKSWFYMVNLMSMARIGAMTAGTPAYLGIPSSTSAPQSQRPVAAYQQAPQQHHQQAAAGAGNDQNERFGREYKIPPLWKRLAAEFIDFLLLFVLKLAVTIVAVEYFSFIDLEKWGKYDFEALFKENMDYDAAFNVTSELIAMEIVNRIFVTFFEAMCLRRGLQGVPGGTTPGKRAMGLLVVSCQRVITLDQQKVLVHPARDLGFIVAFIRSILKNFSMAFFFPASFTVFVFNHNRALYDVVAGCIVVESDEVILPRRR